MSIEKQAIINRTGLKIIRLNIPKGDAIPEHATNSDVVVTVTKGKGTFTINQQAKPITQGDVIDMRPNEPHAVSADEDLELIVAQMKLKEE